MPDKFVDKVYDYDVGQIRILFSSCCDDELNNYILQFVSQF